MNPYLEIAFRKEMETEEGSLILEADVEVKLGEVVCLFGKSGSGKTTFLRLIAGLSPLKQGRISCNGKVWNQDKTIVAPPQMRNTAFVFQDFALFPNMTARGNIDYGKKVENEPVTDLAIERLGIAPLLDKYPQHISGGQKQRVAFVRALAQSPEILLLDEPFSALDFRVKHMMLQLIKDLKAQRSMTIFLVSHIPQDILALGDRLLWIEEGRVEDKKSPSKDIFTSMLDMKA